MTVRKPQRYRLTLEFVLREPRNYAFTRARIEQYFRQLEDTTPGYVPDYLAIEKVSDDDKPAKS